MWQLCMYISTYQHNSTVELNCQLKQMQLCHLSTEYTTRIQEVSCSDYMHLFTATHGSLPLGEDVWVALFLPLLVCVQTKCWSHDQFPGPKFWGDCLHLHSPPSRQNTHTHSNTPLTASRCTSLSSQPHNIIRYLLCGSWAGVYIVQIQHPTLLEWSPRNQKLPDCQLHSARYTRHWTKQTETKTKKCSSEHFCSCSTVVWQAF